jgi:RHH-type rel operon transcriptional repressor/antitoxin RelB
LALQIIVFYDIITSNKGNKSNKFMTTTVKLDAETETRLENLAELTGRTKSYYIRKAIEEMLEDMEDVYMAEKVLEDPNQKYYTMKEIDEMYGLAD